jgi:hypothetical protein
MAGKVGKVVTLQGFSGRTFSKRKRNFSFITLSGGPLKMLSLEILKRGLVASRNSCSNV